ILAEICCDMANMRLPGWVTRSPSHPGESWWGKFHADQWRVFCTINLPVKLIHLWGAKQKDSREYRMLSNFMDLIAAVKLATMQKMTEAQISQYESHMHSYLMTLLELYPGTDISPYQHLALHFGDQLCCFGPTHAWRFFPFEWYNYLLQKVKTNSIWGEMEKTMFKHFCMGQNLHRLFSQQQVPDQLYPIIGEYEKAFTADI
ncbi:hypothetical protein L208DRAFT_1277973, partial [Tricholoma matsutake]